MEQNLTDIKGEISHSKITTREFIISPQQLIEQLDKYIQISI